MKWTNWASDAIEKLQAGEMATVRPRGHSMEPRIRDGQYVYLEPLEPEVGNVVLVKCKGHVYLHLIKARRQDQFLIGNNRGGINGWVHRDAIFGVAMQTSEGIGERL
jgi:hypothetical protein